MRHDALRYRAYLRHMAQDLTDEDIVRLQGFRPRLTPIAFAVRSLAQAWYR